MDLDPVSELHHGGPHTGSDVVSSGTAGLHGPARVRLHERWSFSGDAEGDVGDDPDLGSAEAWLPAHLHCHVRQPGQHAAALPAAHQAVALL